MKKVNTTAASGIEELQRLTIGWTSAIARATTVFSMSVVEFWRKGKPQPTPMR
jgi:hypothetical protein